MIAGNWNHANICHIHTKQYLLYDRSTTKNSEIKLSLQVAFINIQYSNLCTQLMRHKICIYTRCHNIYFCGGKANVVTTRTITQHIIKWNSDQLILQHVTIMQNRILFADFNYDYYFGHSTSFKHNALENESVSIIRCRKERFLHSWAY